MTRTLIPRPRSVAALVMAVLLAAIVFLTVVAAPAEAAYCQPNRYSLGQIEVAVSFDWDPECSDGIAQIWNGVVYDTVCDGRVARVWFEVFNRDSAGRYIKLATSNTYRAPGDCGTSATFQTWRPRSPGSLGWKLTVHTRACSTWGIPPCSTERTHDYFG